VLARGDLPFDALSGAGLAGALDTGILLTAPDELPPGTAVELARYGDPRDVYVHVLGGTTSVSQSIRNDLRGQGYTLVEYTGVNRYDTAYKVKAAIDELRRFGGLGIAPSVFVVSGLSAADALSIGAAAYYYAVPIVLAEPNVLPGPSTAAVGSADVTIIGGLAAVSATVSDRLQQINGGGSVKRVQGRNRYATAAAVADALGGTAGALLVRGDGDNFADALVASTYAGSRPIDRPVPILLTGGPDVRDLPADTQSWLAEKATTISSVTAVGGEAVISAAALAAAARAAGAPR
jgi:putative cell wall-binding protein